MFIGDKEVEIQWTNKSLVFERMPISHKIEQNQNRSKTLLGNFKEIQKAFINLTLLQKDYIQAINHRLEEKCENISAHFAQQKTEYTDLHQQQANNMKQLEKEINNTINEQERECKQLIQKQAEQQENYTAMINHQISNINNEDGEFLSK